MDITQRYITMCEQAAPFLWPKFYENLGVGDFIFCKEMDEPEVRCISDYKFYENEKGYRIMATYTVEGIGTSERMLGIWRPDVGNSFDIMWIPRLDQLVALRYKFLFNSAEILNHLKDTGVVQFLSPTLEQHFLQEWMYNQTGHRWNNIEQKWYIL